MRTRIAPVIMLAVLSPFVAEFLLGDQYLSGLQPAPAQLGMFVLFVAFYGMAAVLIRELGRRLRTGWTGLALLALGYGILEEGLITQSLFNPHYLGLSLIQPGFLPGVGIGAPWTIFVISLHVVWSISTPIAITEAWYGRGGSDRGTEPWLGRVGIVVCLVIFVLAAGATAAFSVLSDQHQFVASVGQLIGAAVAAGLAVLAGVRLRGRARQAGPVTLRTILLSALLGLVASTVFELVERADLMSPWLRAAAMLVLWALTVSIMIGWGRRGSGPAPFGLAIGAVITYSWVGTLSALRAGPAGVIEQLALVIIAFAVIAWAAARSRSATDRQSRPERSPARS